ncbi:hypothetical protein PMAC_002841 [Pneumocystis sp. 'macacae']|nr:hypothetical protein PMAC_002841 [Pneumocystis sp. 'macacae']
MHSTIKQVRQSLRNTKPRKVPHTVHGKTRLDGTFQQHKMFKNKNNSRKNNTQYINTDSDRIKKPEEVIDQQDDLDKDQALNIKSYEKKPKINSKELLEKHIAFYNKKDNKKINSDRNTQLSSTVTTTNKDTQQGISSKLICSPRLEWYYEDGTIFSGEKIEKESVEKLYMKANRYLELEEKTYNTSTYISSSDRHFFESIMKSGTLSDRISALTLSIQESPLHSSKKMRILLNMTKKKNRTEVIQSVQALKDLFISTVLPNRKLKYFKQRFLDSKNVTKKELILWAFEDFLKKYYFEYLEILENLLKDPLSFIRVRIVTYIFELIKDKPEQEQNLLRLLVNKLGDSEKKVASKTSYSILQLTIVHPAMKEVIISEIERLLFRSSVSQHAQYYAIITLNQIVLSKKTTNVANCLINIYFLFFAKLVKLSQNTDNLKRLKGQNFFQKTKHNTKQFSNDTPNIYEKEMNSKLIFAIISGINRAFSFSKIDDKIFYRTLYESIQDFRLFNSSKQTMYLNLLFKAIKADVDKTRVKSFVKRLIQQANIHQITFISGTMILLNELEKIHPEIKSLYNRYKVQSCKKNGSINILNKNNLFIKDNKNISNLSNILDKYDARKRDPRYTNVDVSYLWELIPFLHHFHPTISLYAKSLLHGYQITSKPDLSLYTLSHFLNKFVYRNPKTKSTSQNSIINFIPKKNKDVFSLIKSEIFTDQPLNKKFFIDQEITQVPPDEIFYYKYFSQKHKETMNNKKKLAKTMQDSPSDDEDFNDSESIENDLEKNEHIYESDLNSQEFDNNYLNFNESESDLISSDNFDSASQISINEPINETIPIISTRLKRKLNGKKDYIKKKRLKQLPVFASVDEYSIILKE